MRAANHPVFSSASHEWSTPMELFTTLNAEFRFTLDPCATPTNAKCKTFYTKETNGLLQPWPGAVFCNPPYGRGIDLWMAKAYESARMGSTVVCLVPARTETRWWRFAWWASEWRFVSGRLRFERPSGESDSGRRGNSATFASVLVVFRQGVFSSPVVSLVDRCGHTISTGPSFRNRPSTRGPRSGRGRAPIGRTRDDRRPR
jgi:phage N-6-adenine-methyltransferase